MHGWPLLFFSGPMLLVGAGLSWYAIAAEKNAKKAVNKNATLA